MFRRSKDTLSIILAAATGVICIGASQKPEAEAVTQAVTVALIGDVTGDEVVDGRDATEVLTYYAKTSAGKNITISEYGDVNGDGIIDAVDASTILTAYSCEAVGKDYTWPIATKSNYVSNIEEHLEDGYVWAVKQEPDNSSKTIYVLNEDDGFNCVKKHGDYDEHFYKIVFNEGKSMGYLYFDSYDEYLEVVVEEDYSLMPSWGWID